MCFPVISIRKVYLFFALVPPAGGSVDSNRYALVAQWIEHLVAVQRVAGSIPAKRTKTELNGFFKAKRWDALRARGGLKLNRTLHESPATASLHSATPKEKTLLAFLILRTPDFF